MGDYINTHFLTFDVLYTGVPTQERLGCVEGCKFVDEVVSGVPYIMNDEYLKWVIQEYNIDYVVHGDDPCIVDGKDVYESARRMGTTHVLTHSSNPSLLCVPIGKYLTIPRTEGISTTDIVGRMLLTTRSHHSSSFSAGERPDEEDLTRQLARNTDVASDFTPGFDRKSDFLTTSHVIRLFGAGMSVRPAAAVLLLCPCCLFVLEMTGGGTCGQAPTPESRVVYVAGSWDMFHAGHVKLLEKAKM